MSGWKDDSEKRTAGRDRRANPGAPPARAVLHEAALTYLARGSTTAATLRRVLERKVSSWATKAERAARDPELVATDVAACRDAIEAIVARFREVGLIDDAAYAKVRAQSLSRSGRSRRAIAAKLAAKGVDSDTARAALPEDADVELAAALTFARKRRVGPYARDAEADPDEDRAAVRERARVAKQKTIATMARAGFAYRTCERALEMDRDHADAHLAAVRRLE